MMDGIAVEEAIANREIEDIRERLIKSTSEYREIIAACERALQDWAKIARREWPAKSCELNHGVVGFRLPKAAIKLLVAVETAIERLRARRMTSCIRVKEELDKEALAAYEDEVIEAVGCKRKQGREKFYYEIKREEVR
jgi:phage host-nuclease inhibitor protein Gam